jgi:hypothetical protein
MPDAAGGAWLTDDGFDGQRALRIDARYETQHWTSDPISIRPDQDYLVLWQTRFHGEKRWRFRARFCGIEVAMYGDAGESLGTLRQHTHCWQTPGWRPGWFRFRTPERAGTCRIRFGIETDEPLPGGFDVDAIAISVMPPASSTASGKRRLSCRVLDERTRPTAARYRIVDTQGDPLAAPASISYARNDGAFHPVDESACHLAVAPGRYVITVSKGVEYTPTTITVDVGDADLSIDIPLRRTWDWRRRGWYSGDHHTHVHRHGGSLFPTLTWPDALRAARCEGLDFLPFMGADHYPDDLGTVADELRRPDFVAELTDEITDDFWGHVCPVGVRPQTRRDPRYDDGPMNFDRHAAIAGDGGVLCYAHPYGPLTDGRELERVADPASGLLAREFPIDLALGMPCTIDLLTMEGQRNQLDRKLRDVYRLYNLGFRPALTASTDFHVEQGRQVIGAVRTYARSGSLELDAIAAAYRAGRTFATNGPLIDLRVAGGMPGDEVRLPTGEGLVQVSLSVGSIAPLERAEIVVNGRVTETFLPNEPNRIEAGCEIPVTESLWVAARVIGPKHPYLDSALEGRPIGHGQFAHTSPVFVLVDGRPIRSARKTDADYFASWCDALLTAWSIHLADASEDARHDDLIRERIARARSVFVRRGEQCRRRGAP